GGSRYCFVRRARRRPYKSRGACFIMSFLDLFLIALGLSMDAFAVSICKGLSVQRMQPRHALACGVWFGAFQALMPLLGYLLGAGFAGLIGRFSHWVAFALLAFIGVNMLRESFGGE